MTGRCQWPAGRKSQAFRAVLVAAVAALLGNGLLGGAGESRRLAAMTAASVTGWPNASDTGVPYGTALVNSAYITVTQPGTVISGVDTPGITIAAPNVTVKDSRIRYVSGQSDPYLLVNVASTGFVLENSEIDGGGPGGECNHGIGWSDYTALRVNAHGTGDDPFVVGGSNVTIRDSYVHDLWTCNDNHTDGTQIQNGVSNVIIDHNNYSLVSTVNSAIFLAPDLGPSGSGPVTIDDNYFSGGAYSVYILNGNNGTYIQQGVSLTNNVWGRGTWQYGPFDHTTDTPISPFCGNTFSDGSAFGDSDAGACLENPGTFVFPPTVTTTLIQAAIAAGVSAYYTNVCSPAYRATNPGPCTPLVNALADYYRSHPHGIAPALQSASG